MGDFDSAPERRGTDSVKWDFADYCYPGAGRDGPLLPLWVADMDFPSPAPLVEAVVARARHPVYGYSGLHGDFGPAFAHWMKVRHGATFPADCLHFSPGVVTGLALALNALTEAGDGVIIQPPVYHPFRQIIRDNGRVVVENPLVEEGGHYTMDFAGLEKAARTGAKALVLCSPHNPVGRVWDARELAELSRIATATGLLLISDEIHSDLVYPGRTHLPALNWAEGALRDRLVYLHAPSKTFNMAGLQTSAVVIPNPELGRRFEAQCERYGIHSPNNFGGAAAAAAWREGGPWLDGLLDHLGATAAWLETELPAHLAGSRLRRPEATYLAWVDARSRLGAGGKEPTRLGEDIARKTRVWFDDGEKFGLSGRGWLRLNFGCPRSLLIEALAALDRY